MNNYWNPREELITNYLDVCREAVQNPTTFCNFKSDRRYIPILEHTSSGLGRNHLSMIQENNPQLLTDYPSFWNNDYYGNPTTHDYQFRVCSPTTIQYINVLSSLMKQIGSLSGLRIVEIGGGYGGQAKIITDAFDVESYEIIDLPEVKDLQNKYIALANIKNTKAFDLDSYITKSEYDLVISNYAFTEVLDPLQTWYMENVILKARHGYLTCNGDITSIQSLIDKCGDALQRTSDIAGERESNYILTW